MPWFVFCPKTGGTMLVYQADEQSGEVKSRTLEFETAGDAALWSARFMTEGLTPEGFDDDMNELHLVNLEQGVTIIMTRKEVEISK